MVELRQSLSGGRGCADAKRPDPPAGDRALIIADAKRLDEYLPGLAVFAYNEKRISDLEANIVKLWEQLRGDIPLTESSRWACWGAKAGSMVWSGSRSHSDESDGGGPGDLSAAPTLSLTAQRLQNELALTSRHADRVEALDERLEVLENNYQRISDRMYELKLHRRELIAEWMIVLLLFAEALALLYPLWRRDKTNVGGQIRKARPEVGAVGGCKEGRD